MTKKNSIRNYLGLKRLRKKIVQKKILIPIHILKEKWKTFLTPLSPIIFVLLFFKRLCYLFFRIKTKINIYMLYKNNFLHPNYTITVKKLKKKNIPSPR